MKKIEIKDQLLKVHAEFANFIAAQSEPNFSFATDGKWNAGQQLGHIVLSVAALNHAINNPKYLQPLAEMLPQRPPMDFGALVALYNQLVTGAQAPPRFIPDSIQFEQKEKLVQEMTNAIEELCNHMDDYSESDLDKLTLPHPRLGRLSIREMLFFTIHHAAHHYLRTQQTFTRP